MDEPEMTEAEARETLRGVMSGTVLPDIDATFAEYTPPWDGALATDGGFVIRVHRHPENPQFLVASEFGTLAPFLPHLQALLFLALQVCENRLNPLTPADQDVSDSVAIVYCCEMSPCAPAPGRCGCAHFVPGDTRRLYALDCAGTSYLWTRAREEESVHLIARPMDDHRLLNEDLMPALGAVAAALFVAECDLPQMYKEMRAHSPRLAALIDTMNNGRDTGTSSDDIATAMLGVLAGGSPGMPGSHSAN